MIKTAATIQGCKPIRVTIRQIFDLGLIVLCVILFYLSFPGGRFPGMAWFTIIPLGIALHQKSFRDSFMLALAAAFFCWLSATWWIAMGVSWVANTNFSVVIPFLLLFCLAYAVPYSIAASIYSYMKWTGTISGAIKSALLWTAIHGLTPHILPGNIAYSQYRNIKIIQLVELGGISLLLFMMYLFAFLLVVGLINLPKKTTYAAQSFLLALWIPLLMISYGQFRLDGLNDLIQQPDVKKLAVGIVQPNIPISSRDRSEWKRDMGQLNILTQDLLKKSPQLDLIVWPEISPPISYAKYEMDKTIIDSLIGIENTPMMIAGFQLARNQECRDCYYNVAEFIKPEGIAGVYKKRVLLPFGEYLPYENYFPWLRTIFPNALQYLPGEESKVFTLSENFTLLPLICYESLFPKLVSEGIAKGANIIINPVNDAWFGNSAGSQVHMALAIFRAVEFRIPLIRATNSGISAFIDIRGNIIPDTETSLLKSTVVSGSVSVVEVETPFQKFGNAFLWCTVMLSILFLIRRAKMTGLVRLYNGFVSKRSVNPEKPD